MKFSNTKALTSRLLVALTLAVVSVAGMSGIAEAATCSTCHAPVGSTTDMRPVESTWRNITTGSIVGSHSKHIPFQTTNKNDCTVCHGAGVTAYTNNHTNNATDIASAVGYSKGTLVTQTGNPTLGTCSSASCHVTSYNTSYVPTPTWGVATTCVGCHVAVGAFTGTGQSPNTGSHTKHLAASATCGSCHTGAVAGSSGGTAHVDGNIDVVASYGATNVTKHTQGSGYSSCSNAGAASCHVSPYATTSVPSTVWGTPGCAACHSTTGAFTGTGLSPNTGSHTKHMSSAVTPAVTCASCHTGAVAGTTGGSVHRDGNVDVVGGYTANVTKHTAGSGYGRCNNASCHADPYSAGNITSPTWGVVSGCGECHVGIGAFTVNGGPITGSHTKHMNVSGTTCNDCHVGAVAGSSGGVGHIDSHVDVLGYAATNVTKHTAGSGYSRCSTAACHEDPYSTTGFTVSPTWGVSTTCGECHVGAGAFTGTGQVPVTGAHTIHVARGAICGQCHAGAIVGSSGGNAHADHNIDVTGPEASGYTANITKHAIGTPYAGQCMTTCHSSPYLTGSGQSPAWGVKANGSCGLCHSVAGAFTGAGNSPNTGSHTKHMASGGGVSCASCHAGAVSDTTGGAAHNNTFVDVIGGYPANVVKHTIGSGYSRCSSATCHANPYGAGNITSPTWGVSTTCGECHTGVGAFSGTSTSPTTGSHTKHQAINAACNACHTGAIAGTSGGTVHIDGNIDVIGGYSLNVTKHAAGSNYGKCTNASCHADPYDTTPVPSPTWGAGAAGCANCHTLVGAFTGAGQVPTTGSHTRHQASGALCNQCHLNASAGVTGGSGHGDSNIDVTGGYPLNVAKHIDGSGYGKCTTATCHANPYSVTGNITSPTWGVVSGCGECHIGIGAFTATGGVPITGKHTKHQAAGATCGQCHAGAITGLSGGTAHTDGNVDVILGYTANVTKHAAGSTYTGTCTTICHVNPYVTTAGTSPSWGAASLGCALCHSNAGAFTGTGSSPNTGSHTKHMASGGGVSCASCHAGAVSDTTGGATHNNTFVDVIGGYPANVVKHPIGVAGAGYSRCSTATCHANPYGAGNITSPTWGVSTTCGECHTGVGAFSGTSTSPTTGSHTKHQAINAACNACHTGAVAGTSGGTAHIDGNIDVVGGYSLNVTKHAAGSNYGKCTNASCHADPYDTTPVPSPTWGAGAAGCANCHTLVGAFTGAGQVPTTGSHTRHQASGALCNQCHLNASAGVTGGTNHGDANIDVIGGYPLNVTKHVDGSGYGKCTTATCHANPYSVTGNITSPTWGVVSGCGECHIGIGAFTAAGGVPVTGKHTKHQAAGATCGQCHAGAITGLSGGTAHTDGNVDVILGYTANVTKHAAGSTYTGTCTTSCHQTPYATTGSSPSWGAASLGCALCHSNAGAFTGTGSSPNTGSHTKHMASGGGVSCASCHAGAVSGTTGGSGHGNNFIDVTGGYPANIAKHAIGVAGAGNFTCTAATCHANPYSVTGYITTPTWGVSTLCGECHTGVGAFTGTSTSPTTGSHTVHQAAAAACNACHTGAVAGTSGGTAHIDGNIDVIGYSAANVTKHAAGTYANNCTTTQCHGAASPTWGYSSGLQTCLKCHGYRSNGWKSITGATATTDSKVGMHFKHISSTTYKYSPAYSCAVCHSGSIAGPAYSTTGHNDSPSPAEALFGALAATKGTAPTYSTGTGTCSNVYCHGAGMDSNVSNPPVTQPLTNPVWNTSFLTGVSAVGNGSTTSGTGDCARCHGYPPMTASTHGGKIETDCIICHPHVNAAGTAFTNASLHINGIVEATGGSCTGCHASVVGTPAVRANVMKQFTTASNSHHYQGTAKISTTVCYACHWEADSLGAMTAYHGKTTTSVVDLVIWNATTRPATYTADVTVSTYLSGGATATPRAQILKINNHCLGCHSDANKSITPFPTDSRTPSTYSWEGKTTAQGGFGVVQSIGAKYLSTVTTPWGKFTGNYTNNKNQTKAYSAHNSANNARGWSTLAENLQSVTAVTNYPNTSGNASGANAVLCFDCHNSHGSAAKTPTDITSSYDSATGVKKGGILKQTIAGQGGYTNTYTPGSAGSVAEKNAHNAGAGLCFDCHNNANTNAATLSGSSTPWGYTGTYGASQAIYGYNDTPYFGKTGGTFAKTITHTYTAGTSGAMNVNRGGHFGASSTLINAASMSIGGLCTPCHDPHGVSPGISTPANAVPLLKGTFVTSPYKVDVAGTAISRGGGSNQVGIIGGAATTGFVPGYHIDQNTMQAGRTMKPVAQTSSWAFATSAKSLQTLNSTQFGGLCEKCHNKTTLNSSAAASSANWKSSGRIHNSVAGWASTAGGNVNNTKHAFTCSKCHTTHNSRLPRLLVTNCLDVKHGGRVVSQATVPRSTSLYLSPKSATSSGGRGRFPGGGGGRANVTTATNPGPWYFGNTTASTAAPTAATTCHESATAGSTTFSPNSQQWNTKSLW